MEFIKGLPGGVELLDLVEELISCAGSPLMPVSSYV